MNRNRKERRLIKNMQVDNVVERFDMRMGMKVVREESGDSSDSGEGNGKRAEESGEEDGEESRCSEFEEDKVKKVKVVHNLADYDQIVATVVDKQSL